MNFIPLIIEKDEGKISILEMGNLQEMTEKLNFSCPFFLKSHHDVIKQQKIAAYLQMQYHYGEKFVGIEKDDLGKPFLINLEEIQFSISHFHFLHVVFFSKKNIKNGIDIIAVEARAEKIKNKFLSTEEIYLCKKNIDFNLTFGAKEACFKKIGGGLQLKKDLLIEKITEKDIFVKFIKKNVVIKLKYFIYKDFFIIWTIN